jgi:hypothetical protein
MVGDSERETAARKEFQQRLPVLLQSGEELYDDPHLQGCDVCRALVVDLEQIGDAARRRFERYN